MAQTFVDYGKWGITEREYTKARELARGDGEVAEAAWQLVRYCQGQPFYRDDAHKALNAIRGWVS